MFASEMIDKSTVVGAGDDDPADLTFADGANVAVISGCTVWLADVVRLRARWSRGVSRSDAATNECLLPTCLASECHHGLQDVGCAQKRFATRRASSDTIEQSPQGSGLHLCRRALRGVLQCV
jgi:hypothetical protein